MSGKNERLLREHLADDPNLVRLFDDLIEMWRKLDQGLRDRHARSVPFADLLVDRWARAETLGFGEGSSIYDSAVVIGDVRVGANTWIGPFTVLDGSGGLEIGSFCSISAGVQIYTHDSVEWAVSGGQATIDRLPTRIGSKCYIGPNVVIAKGVTLGDGAVVGANSLVLEDVPSGERVVGSPARPIGTKRG